MTKRAATKKATKKAAKAATPRWATGKCPTATRLAVIERDGFACIYCRAEGDLTIDHIVPQSVMTDHRPSNLVACCWACNRARSVVDADLFCRHIARRTREPWRNIWARVLAALEAPTGK
jgi:5-methylcytosine-specific restriction endonuclease McrA